ncbi:MAG: polyprenyl synthetase family protein [Gaiellales bacterium]
MPVRRDRAGIGAAAAYGFEVGMAFQLSDDLVDVTSSAADSGKTPGTDLREGVHTLPVLLALEDDPDGELAALLAAPLGDGEVDRALALLRAGDAIDRARDEARLRVRAAIDHLAPFGDRPVATALTRLAEYAVDRIG